MGFAAFQDQAGNDGKSQISALELLQINLIAADHLSATDIYQAIATDISNQLPLNQTILMKLLSSPRIPLTSFDFQKLAILLRDAMVLLPLQRAELFINYAQSAALCMKNIYPHS